MFEAVAVAVDATKIRTHSPLALWHLLSLDAPTVATLWLCFVARSTHTALSPLLAPAMFLAVWIIYVADRLLDTEYLEPRHHFHQRHRSPFLAGITVAMILLALLLARMRLPPVYFALGILFLAWFAVVHLPRVPASLRLPKELVTGLIFSSAIFAPELPHHLAGAFAFALLCTLNCAWIQSWEPPQPAHPLTRSLLRVLPQATTLLLLAALSPSPLGMAIALAAGALLALNHWRGRLSPTTLRAAADLALLTPLLLLHIALPR
jgi:hypothetical protein